MTSYTFKQLEEFRGEKWTEHNHRIPDKLLDDFIALPPSQPNTNAWVGAKALRRDRDRVFTGGANFDQLASKIQLFAEENTKRFKIELCHISEQAAKTGNMGSSRMLVQEREEALKHFKIFCAEIYKYSINYCKRFHLEANQIVPSYVSPKGEDFLNFLVEILDDKVEKRKPFGKTVEVSPTREQLLEKLQIVNKSYADDAKIGIFEGELMIEENQNTPSINISNPSGIVQVSHNSSGQNNITTNHPSKPESKAAFWGTVFGGIVIILMVLFWVFKPPALELPNSNKKESSHLLLEESN